MQATIKKICDDIVRSYKTHDNVLGVLLFGSAARGKFDGFSDIDIFILLKKKGRFSRKNFIKDNLRVDIILNTLADAKRYIDNDKNSLRRITSHMLAHGIILFQRGDSLSSLIKAASANLKLKTKYSADEVLMHKYSIDDFWGEVQRDLKNKDYIAFGIDSNLLMNNIIELLLKLRGTYLPQPNLLAGVLKKIDKKAAAQIIDFYKTNDYQKKLRILKNIIGHVYKKSGGALPKNWSIK